MASWLVKLLEVVRALTGAGNWFESRTSLNVFCRFYFRNSYFLNCVRDCSDLPCAMPRGGVTCTNYHRENVAALGKFSLKDEHFVLYSSQVRKYRRSSIQHTLDLNLFFRRDSLQTPL